MSLFKAVFVNVNLYFTFLASGNKKLIKNKFARKFRELNWKRRRTKRGGKAEEGVSQYSQPFTISGPLTFIFF